MDQQTIKPEYTDSIYYIGKPGLNWWARIYKRDDPNRTRWILEMRWNYEHSDEPFDPQDQKSWHGFAAPDDSQEQLDKVRLHLRKGFRLLEEQFPGEKVDCVEMQCFSDDSKYFFNLASRPWAHVRTVGEPFAGLRSTDHRSPK